MEFDKCILLADDDDKVLNTLTGVLDRAFPDYEVIPSSSGEALLKEKYELDAHGHSVDLIVTDGKLAVNEGDMNGDDLARIVKQETPKTPVVLFTGYSDEEMVINALNARVDLYLKKPIDNEHLIKACDYFLEQKERTKGPRLHMDELGLVIKKAENKYELEAWQHLRYQTYVQEKGYLTEEDIKQAERVVKMPLLETEREWDLYDTLPSTGQIVVMRYQDGQEGEAVAGARELVGQVAVDKIHNLSSYRAQGITPREISRFIIGDRKLRRTGSFLLEFVRFLYHTSREYPTVFCTTQSDQQALYEKMGFVPVGDPVESESYGLKGAWRPMMFDSYDIMINAANEATGKYRKVSITLFNQFISPILSPDDRMRAGVRMKNLFEETGYFNQRHGGSQNE